MDDSPGYLEENIGWDLKAVAISFLILDCGFVALRFYARYLQQRNLRLSSFRPDDWVIIPALIFCLGTQICAFVAVDYGGVGRHVQYIEQDPDVFRIWYQTCMIAVASLYIVSVALPKIAILCLYLQIFIDRLSRWATWATMGALIINVIVMVPILIAKCHPISYGWTMLINPELKDGWCAKIEPRLQFASLANIVTDVSMLLLPIPTLYKLQTDRGTKFGLVLTFGMALAGLVASCLRFAAYFETQAYDDETWASVDLVAWCIVEPGIYMFVACQMTFRPLAVAFFETRIGKKLAHRLPNSLHRYKSAASKSAAKTAGRDKSWHVPIRLSSPVGHSMYESSVEADANEYPSVPSSVYDANIWIRHEFNVRNASNPNNCYASDASTLCSEG